MIYLLDTVAFIKAATNGGVELGPSARKALLNQKNERVLSSISLTEIAMLVSVGRFPKTRQDILKALDDLVVEVLPYKRLHAERYFSLPTFTEHRDPFDRMIIATALQEQFPVITSDRRFELYSKLEVVW